VKKNLKNPPPKIFKKK